MKLNVSLADELVARIDAYAAENYMSRSGMLSIAAAQYLNQHDALKAVKGIAVAIRKIADEGKIDDETLKELEDFERFCQMLTGGK